jgi:Haemolysin-III related
MPRGMTSGRYLLPGMKPGRDWWSHLPPGPGERSFGHANSFVLSREARVPIATKPSHFLESRRPVRPQVSMRLGTPAVAAAGCATYGVSMFFLYAASTLYHARPEGRDKRVLLLFDYVGIYLLIAGRYTLKVIINPVGPVDWSHLAVVWGIAAVGTAVKIGRFNRFDGDSPMPYLVMSGVWLGVFRQT